MAGATDDLDLVRAAQDGDRTAMDQLLRRHYDRVYAVCRRITGNDADAADAAALALTYLAAAPMRRRVQMAVGR